MKTKISHIIKGMIEWLPQEGSREAAETQERLKSGARDPLFRELEISHFCFSLCLGLTFSGPIQPLSHSGQWNHWQPQRVAESGIAQKPLERPDGCKGRFAWFWMPVQRPTLPTDDQWARAFIDRRRELHAETGVSSDSHLETDPQWSD